MSSPRAAGIGVPEEWHSALAAVREAAREAPTRETDSGAPTSGALPHVVYVIGAPDSGKSTFCRWAKEQLEQSTAVALLDADPGQGAIGPPTAISLRGPARPGRGAEAGAARVPLHHAFVGDTTPRGSLLQLATALRVLHLLAAREQAELLLVDACGFVDGALGREIHLHSIDLLAPHGVVVIGDLPHHNGLGPALSAARRAERTIYLRVPSAAGRRSIAQRRAARLRNYRQYFAEASEQTFSLRGRELRGYLPRMAGGGEEDDRDFVEGRAVGLCDGRGEMLALGRAERADPRRDSLQIVGPAVDADRITSVRFGRARIPAEALTRQRPPSPPSSHQHAP